MKKICIFILIFCSVWGVWPQISRASRSSSSLSSRSASKNRIVRKASAKTAEEKALEKDKEIALRKIKKLSDPISFLDVIENTLKEKYINTVEAAYIAFIDSGVLTEDLDVTEVDFRFYLSSQMGIKADRFDKPINAAEAAYIIQYLYNFSGSYGVNDYYAIQVFNSKGLFLSPKSRGSYLTPAEFLSVLSRVKHFVKKSDLKPKLPDFFKELELMQEDRKAFSDIELDRLKAITRRTLPQTRKSRTIVRRSTTPRRRLAKK